MNKHLRELAGQTLDEVAPYTWNNLSYDKLWAMQEHFGKLIVQECIVQIQLTTARDPQTSAQYRQSVGHIHRIRQHFGITE